MNRPRVDGATLVIVAKSRWDPPMRREHALARLAARAGHQVYFLEAPDDVRALRRTAHRWLPGLWAPHRRVPEPRLSVLTRSSVVPAHRGALPERIDSALLRRAIGGCQQGSSTLVATQPWHWPAVSLSSGRRVLDVADDWAAMIPAAGARIRELYAAAALEADEIIVASERLAALFPNRSVSVVRNGVEDSLLASPARDRSRRKLMTYVGTLSERFDAPLVSELVDRLPGYHLDLHGPCAYAESHGRPSRDLQQLLDRPDGRVRWLGPLPRAEVPTILDAADILLLPNRAIESNGQDSMKVYDYSARGRPILATRAALDGVSETPPHIYVGADPAELATLASRVDLEPSSWAAERVDWAKAQTWASRWQQWEPLLFGR